MNTIKIIFLATVVTIATITSCKKTTTTGGGTFTHATMKPWFDNNCASCHASGASASSKWLYDVANYNSIKTEISTIYKDVYTNKSMPQGKQLSADDLAKFKAWYDAGYPIN